MPQIGRIDVPDDLWEELVRCEAYALASDVLDRMERINLTIDGTDKWTQLDQWLQPGIDYDTANTAAQTRLLELVQQQVPNSDIDQVGSDAYREWSNVITAVTDFTHQVTFDALFDVANLKSVINQRVNASKGQSLSFKNR